MSSANPLLGPTGLPHPIPTAIKSRKLRRRHIGSSFGLLGKNGRRRLARKQPIRRMHERKLAVVVDDRQIDRAVDRKDRRCILHTLPSRRIAAEAREMTEARAIEANQEEAWLNRS